MTPKQISDLHKKDKWKQFINSCTGGKGDNRSSHNQSSSNKEEFRELVQCVVNLDGLREYFGQETTDNPRWGRVRISHQGNQPMSTWNANAKWLNRNYESTQSTQSTQGTQRKYGLKPDLISAVVKPVESGRLRKAQLKYVQFAKPKTILPPPDDWRPEQIKDDRFPIVESKSPVWECLVLFW